MKMTKEIIAVGVGVAIGGYAVYKMNQISKEKKNASQNDELVETVNSELVLKKADELFINQKVVDVLDGKELADWFRANIELTTSGVTQVIAWPTELVLKGLGYEYNPDISPDTNLLQFYYRAEKNEILKIRNISFSEIDDTLKQLLEDNDGMVSVE